MSDVRKGIIISAAADKRLTEIAAKYDMKVSRIISALLEFTPEEQLPAILQQGKLAKNQDKIKKRELLHSVNKKLRELTPAQLEALMKGLPSE